MTDSLPSRTSWQTSTLRTVVSVASPAVIGEAVQHLIEYKLGMYVVGDGIALGQEAHWRQIGIVIKVLGFVWTIARARSCSNLLALGETMSSLAKIVAFVLLVAVHYGLNYAAVGQPSWFALAAILFDCLVIGVLALALGVLLPKRSRRSRAG